MNLQSDYTIKQCWCHRNGKIILNEKAKEKYSKIVCDLLNTVIEKNK